jgi:hypothetical protein
VEPVVVDAFTQHLLQRPKAGGIHASASDRLDRAPVKEVRVLGRPGQVAALITDSGSPRGRRPAAGSR